MYPQLLPLIVEYFYLHQYIQPVDIGTWQSFPLLHCCEVLLPTCIIGKNNYNIMNRIKKYNSNHNYYWIQRGRQSRDQPIPCTEKDGWNFLACWLNISQTVCNPIRFAACDLSCKNDNACLMTYELKPNPWRSIFMLCIQFALYWHIWQDVLAHVIAESAKPEIVQSVPDQHSW